MSTTISPNMNLPVPVVSVEPGPAWATDINNCMATIDSHDHSSGKGVQITPSGININTDLAFNNSNATLMRTVRFNPNPSLGASDLDAVYVNGVDLYYVDGNGNQVRITQSGAVAGTPGSIANLVSPASASYVAADQTFVWQSDVNTAANMDGGSVILRQVLASAKGVTLASPTSLAADYTITMPSAVPGATNILTMDASGNIGNALNVDNSSLQIASNVISVKALGITNAMLAGGITNDKLGPINSQISSSCSSFSSASGSIVAVTNLTVTITTVGRPVWVGLIPDGSTGIAGNSFLSVSGVANTSFVSGDFYIYNGSSVIADNFVRSIPQSTVSGGVFPSLELPVGQLYIIDVPASGTQIYTVKVKSSGGAATAGITNAKLFAYEL